MNICIEIYIRRTVGGKNKNVWQKLEVQSGPKFKQPETFSHINGNVFIFKPARQYVKRYHSVLNCALNMENLISNNFCKCSK
jgi:ethanolamine utilization cobalamin adenosyltransferase